MIAPPICDHCGQGIDSGVLCANCRSSTSAIGGLRAAAYLDGPLRQAVHAFKYNGVRDLAGPLGEILYGAYARYTPPADILIPVPLHAGRLNWRGFNQSLLLAEELAARSGLPVTSQGLVRTRETASQVGLSAADRRKNVDGAFAWRGPSIAGQRVLLIDDVCTTGATMEACAAALYAVQAASVWGLALAREKWANR